MHDSFRKSMAWLHTWAGVMLGCVLFAVFWMGSLSVFDIEIDRWMKPATRGVQLVATVSVDHMARPAFEAIDPAARMWLMALPTPRAEHAVLTVAHRDGRYTTRELDVGTGLLLPAAGTLAATGFIFPFHVHLHLQWLQLGYWLVGLAAVGLLVLVVSGVVIHRKLLADFFLFRPSKPLQRSSLDLHNLSGVLGLPFHTLIALSGLVLFIQVYFPTLPTGAYGWGDAAAARFEQEAFGRYSRPAQGEPGPMASIDTMVAQARAGWGGAPVAYVRVWHPGDRAAYVELVRSDARQVSTSLDRVYLDAGSGALLHRHQNASVMDVQRFLSGAHMVRFDHALLRWLYFGGGLLGCLMIATGLLFWLESRRASHLKKGLSGVPLVEALTIGSVAGVVLATMAFLLANRWLPADAAWGALDRAGLEVVVFYALWLASFVHGWASCRCPSLQPCARAWQQQCVGIGALAVAAVLSNAWTTGDHLPRALVSGDLRVAGVDAALLLLGLLSVWTAWHLGRHRARSAVPPTVSRAVGEGRV